MTSKTNTAEGGTNGTGVTAGNSAGASGDALVVVLGAGTTAVFDNTSPAHGSLCYAVTGASAVKAELQMTGFTGLSFSQRFYVKFSALPSASSSTATIMNLFNAGSTAIVSWVVNASNQPIIQLSGVTAKTFTTITVNTSTWYRFEIQGTVGGSTSTGVLNAQIFSGDSNTALDTFSTTTGNLGTTNVNFCSWGKESGSSTYVATLRFDDLAMRDTVTTAWGPQIIAPTAAFTTAITGTDLDVDGSASTASSPATISSYDWNWGDATAHGSGATASHTYAAAGTYTVTLTVTDSNSTTGSITHSAVITAPPTASTYTSIGTSNGTLVGGASALAVLTDVDGAGAPVLTSFLASVDNPTASVLSEGQLGPVTAPQSGSPLLVTVWIDRVTSASGSISAELREGSPTGTIRSTLTGLAVPDMTASGGSGSVLSGTVSALAVVELSFPWTDVSAVVDWNKLHLKITGTAA